MSITVTDAEKLIAAGEGLEVDFKRELSKTQAVNICKEIAAFATGVGGYVFLGVADDKSIYGLPDAKSVAERIDSWISEYIFPKPIVDSTVLNISGKDILVIQVANGTALYYTYKEKPYFRIGSKSCVMSVKDIEYLKQTKDYETFIASLQAETQLAKSMSISYQYAIAPGFIGQGELATKNYIDIKNSIISDFTSSIEFQTIKSEISICQSTAAVASSHAAILESRLKAISDKLDDIILRYEKIKNDEFERIEANFSVVQSNSAVISSRVNILESKLSALEAKLLAAAETLRSA